jgi:hypothetical protein
MNRYRIVERTFDGVKRYEAQYRKPAEWESTMVDALDWEPVTYQTRREAKQAIRDSRFWAGIRARTVPASPAKG